ncbi:MAG TPA: acetyl-CoA carboxylase carboxyltransferase subunit alpha/beta [Thermomicrobiales bacterium]|nr:acetyl-CoA carboxylase carboxyltransferase subunit alpha/beta [Thermomicrobiales bacterium]
MTSTSVPRESSTDVDIDDVRCPRCSATIGTTASWLMYRVCGECGHHAQISALDRIKTLLDEDSFEETNARLVSVDPLGFSDLQPYRARVQAAREKTGLTEAVITGRGSIHGHELVIAVVDFGFLGGSMGSVVGEKIALAFEHAVDRTIPIVSVVASGGARMQEGMLSLVQMAKTAAAAKRAHVAHVPYISILTNPTTGGMYASFATQGDIIFAEPGAMIGFAGPRVIQGVAGKDAGEQALRSHTAEFLVERGFVDSIIDRRRQRNTLATLLRLIASGQQRVVASPATSTIPHRGVDLAWDVVQAARREDRPTTMDYIRRISPQFVELHGDRAHGDDPAVVAGIGEIAGLGVVFLGHERGHGDPVRRNGQALPEGYRKALRMMRLAQRLRCPLVTFIDTPGAFLGIESEERGLATSMSECLAEMSAMEVPVVATIIGEGGSGGALAFGVADRVLMQEHAIYSVIAPEGAAAILYRDVSRAPEVAEALKITALDCTKLGVADVLVPEPEGGAHLDPDLAAAMLRDALVSALADIQGTSGRRLASERYRKFRQMGQVNTYWREFLSKEASELGMLVARTVGSIRGRLTSHDSEHPHDADDGPAEDTPRDG